MWLQRELAQKLSVKAGDGFVMDWLQMADELQLDSVRVLCMTWLGTKFPSQLSFSANEEGYVVRWLDLAASQDLPLIKHSCTKWLVGSLPGQLVTVTYLRPSADSVVYWLRLAERLALPEVTSLCMEFLVNCAQRTHPFVSNSTNLIGVFTSLAAAEPSMSESTARALLQLTANQLASSATKYHLQCTTISTMKQQQVASDAKVAGLTVQLRQAEAQLLQLREAHVNPAKRRKTKAFKTSKLQ